MPIVRAKTKCYVGNALRREGETFEWNGPMSAHLEAVNQGKAAAVVASAEEEVKAPAKAKRAAKAEADDNGAA